MWCNLSERVAKWSDYILFLVTFTHTLKTLFCFISNPIPKWPMLVSTKTQLGLVENIFTDAQD
jgi:hypothetical protein